mgnify:CR=1 FL=1
MKIFNSDIAPAGLSIITNLDPQSTILEDNYEQIYQDYINYDFANIEANKLEIVKVEYEPQKVFDELIKLTKARIGEKPLDFKISIAEDIPDYLNGDYVRLKQIAVNLLTNAIKYTNNFFGCIFFIWNIFIF